MSTDEHETPVVLDDGAPTLDATDDPPVVARLVVEIRSDGTRTIARGAMEDRISGEQVSVEAKAGSPLELAGALARMLLSTPRLARRMIHTSDEGAAMGDEKPSLRKSLRRALGARRKRS